MVRESLDNILDDLIDTPRRAVHGSIIDVGRRTISTIARLGDFMMYVRDIFVQMFKPPFRVNLVFQHLEFIGNQSLVIIIMTGLSIGAVFSLLVGAVFRIFQAEALTGGATALAFSRELAPMMVSFLVAGRAGSAMTAELATMRVTEQLDAMEAMAVDPIHYLVVPRFIAALIVTPFLTGLFLFVSVLGAFMMGVGMFNVDQGMFFEKIRVMATPNDILMGLEKSLVFAGIVATISCRYGLRASGGARGVGTATTDSVITTLLTLLSVDFVLTYFQIVLFK
jgi:phospholipid/cholesterol/gamma-HCH transport system permease protein